MCVCVCVCVYILGWIQEFIREKKLHRSYQESKSARADVSSVLFDKTRVCVWCMLIFIHKFVY